MKWPIYGRRSSLRSYEAACLAAIGERMSSDARAILVAQKEAIERIERFSDNKLVVLHLRTLTDNELFVDRRTELRAATFVMRGATGDPTGGTLVVHRGRVSSLEFDRSPTTVRGTPIRVSDLHLLHDLMVMPTCRVADASDELHGALRPLGAGLVPTSIAAPVSQTEQAAYMASLDTSTPDDYEQLLAMTDGFVVGEWRFLGTRARTLTLPNVTYIITAEREDGASALCFRKGQRSPSVVLFDELDTEERAEYADFLTAFERSAGIDHT